MTQPGRRRGAAPASRALDSLRRVPWPLWVLLLLGVGLRAQLWADYHPAILNLADSQVYANLANGDLFGDPTKASGYPLFLRLLHAISDQLEFTIAFQHLLGLATGTLLYATMRRLTAPVWAALVGAAAGLLSLDQIFLEHAVMSETTFTFLFVLSLYLAVRALDPSRPLVGALDTRHAWIVSAASALALAAWMRPVALPVIALLAVWFAAAIPGSWRARLANAALGGAAGMLVVLGYFAIHAADNGYFGVSEASGWALYSRTAPFADCSRFDPPEGTRRLCESTAVESRAGPDFYGQQPESPARRLFGAPPNGNEQLGAFARAAIRAQPLSYAEDVTRDFIRYFSPGFKPQDFSGVGYELLDIDRRAPGQEEFGVAALNDYYAPDAYEIDASGTATLADIQQVLRVHPKLLLASVILGVVAVFLAAGVLRWGVLLLLGASLAIMVLAPATAVWSSRYAIPADGPLAACGAIGAWLLGVRISQRRRGRSV